ncbi:hypothetical protein MUK42_33103 [Musa troglodytarum]|uniref:Uncharacterized protein n=1 Tax=Musa troglodytarum TaxID=320322 RepID=A0A9E7FCL9_9LILI|nr:hypothetical protein MUK42_33103 [Musa troglodytarum]
MQDRHLRNDRKGDPPTVLTATWLRSPPSPVILRAVRYLARRRRFPAHLLTSLCRPAREAKARRKDRCSCFK